MITSKLLQKTSVQEWPEKRIGERAFTERLLRNVEVQAALKDVIAIAKIAISSDGDPRPYGLEEGLNRTKLTRKKSARLLANVSPQAVLNEHIQTRIFGDENLRKPEVRDVLKMARQTQSTSSIAQQGIKRRPLRAGIVGLIGTSWDLLPTDLPAAVLCDIAFCAYLLMAGAA